MESNNNTPFFGPLLALLRSRKFIAALMTLVIDLIVAYVPELEPVRSELLAVFTLIGVGLIASIAYEDGEQKAVRGEQKAVRGEAKAHRLQED